MDKFLETREELDYFGKITIPKHALFGAQTWRSVQNIAFSNHALHQYPLYIKNLAMVKKAAALANKETSLIDDFLMEAIIHACDEIIDGHYFEHFIVDMFQGGGGISINMNMNEVIANLANEKMGKNRGTYFPIHPIDHVNYQQSTSDVCYTASRLAVIEYYEILDIVLGELYETMKMKAEELMPVTTISRTCLQDGMQVQLGELFSGYVAVIRRSHQTVHQAVMDLTSINLGGTVIGSGKGASESYRYIVVERLAEVTNQKMKLRENLFDAAQNIDDITKVMKELSLLATTLIKIAKDLRLLASGPEAGFSEIYLPTIIAGSSFFPGKMNPVIPETVIQGCFQVLGNERVVQASSEHGELNLNVFDSFAATNVMDSLTLLTNIVEVFTEKCIEDMKANEQRCAELANSYIPIVLEMKEKFGYAAVSKMIKEHGKEYLKEIYKAL